MGRPVSTDLQNLLDLDDANTQTTLDLYLANSSEIHVATEAFTIDSIDYTDDLRKADEIKESIFSPTDRVNVTIQNVDKVFGPTITAEDLVKAEAIVGRYYRDPKGVLPAVWVELFRGEARPTDLDELEAKIEILHDLTAAGYCVANWALAENCQLVYKGPDCRSTSTEPSCNKRRKSPMGCAGKTDIGDDETHEFGFGGMEFPDVQVPSVPVGGGSGDPGGSTGGGGDGWIHNCPRVDQWIPASGPHAEIETKLAGSITRRDWLWNPLLRRFSKVRSAVIIRNVPIWQVESAMGVSGFSSVSHPVFPHREHEGLPVADIPGGSPLLLWRRNSDLVNNAVHRSRDTGTRGDVVRIELEDGHVYAYGDSEDIFIVCHNSKQIFQ